MAGLAGPGVTLGMRGSISVGEKNRRRIQQLLTVPGSVLEPQLAVVGPFLGGEVCAAGHLRFAELVAGALRQFTGVETQLGKQVVVYLSGG